MKKKILSTLSFILIFSLCLGITAFARPMSSSVSRSSSSFSRSSSRSSSSVVRGSNGPSRSSSISSSSSKTSTPKSSGGLFSFFRSKSTPPKPSTPSPTSKSTNIVAPVIIGNGNSSTESVQKSEKVNYNNKQNQKHRSFSWGKLLLCLFIGIILGIILLVAILFLIKKLTI